MFRWGGSFSIASKDYLNNNIYEMKRSSGQSISYVAEKESYQKQSKREQCWISNAIAGWAVLWNRCICVFRDLSHRMCLFFFFFLHNCQLYQWRKWKMYHSKLVFFFFFHFLNCTLSIEKWKFSLSFFLKKCISVTSLHYQSVTNSKLKGKTRHNQIHRRHPICWELTRCSKV